MKLEGTQRPLKRLVTAAVAASPPWTLSLHTKCGSPCCWRWCSGGCSLSMLGDFQNNQLDTALRYQVWPLSWPCFKQELRDLPRSPQLYVYSPYIIHLLQQVPYSFLVQLFTSKVGIQLYCSCWDKSINELLSWWRAALLWAPVTCSCGLH